MTNGAEVAAKLQQAASGLFMPSESEFPFSPVRWAAVFGNITPQHVLEFTGHPQDASVEVVELDHLFRNLAFEQEWHDDQQKENVKKYKKLLESIKSHLSDVKVYRVGRRSIDVYIVGKTPSGDLAGLTTKVIET